MSWTAAYGPDPSELPTLWMLKAQLGERGRGWRTLLYPLPFDQPGESIEPFEMEPPEESVDPWSARLHRVFDMTVPPIHDSVLMTPNDDRFIVAIHPDGRFASATTLFGFN